jgi:hypothetical protein
MKKTPEYKPNHLYHPEFKYTTSSQTDIRKTFERIKAEQQQEAKVIQIERRRGR